MRLWIIYDIKHENSKVPTSMLQKAQENGLDAQLFFFQKFSYIATSNEIQLYYDNKRIEKLPDVAFIRGYDRDIHHYLKNNNVKFVNSVEGTFKVLDKYQMHLYASQMGVKQPKSIVGDNITYTELCEFFDNRTFVMKDRFGMRGNKVFLIHNEEEFLNAKLDKNTNYLYQEYIEASKGRDVRVYIVGNKAFGPIERYSTNGDFRSNLSQGGSSKAYLDLPENIIQQSLKITQSLGLNFCSVDYLIADDNYLLCELNANAAFSPFFKLGIDLQAEIMEYIKNL